MSDVHTCKGFLLFFCFPVKKKQNVEQEIKEFESEEGN